MFHDLAVIHPAGPEKQTPYEITQQNLRQDFRFSLIQDFVRECVASMVR